MEPGQDEYSDGMVEHDAMVGDMLKLVDDLGIANDTIVMYSTDNGPTTTLGRMLAPRHSGARRTRTGKAPIACRLLCAGPVTSKPV